MLGLYPSPVSLWAEKVGKADPTDLSNIEAVQMGHVMQGTIQRMFTDQTGIEARHTDDEFKIAPEVDYLAAHTDGQIDNTTILEIKNFSGFRRKEFGDWGSDDVPLTVYTQCVHEAICWNAKTVFVAVLFGGQEFQVYELNPSLNERNSYLERADKFWSTVTSQTPPEPQNANDVALLFPQHNDDAVVADDALIQRHIELVTIRNQIKQFEKTEEEIAAEFKLFMGEAGTVMGGDKPLVTWKKSADSRFFDAKAFEQDHPELFKKYTGIRPGSRRFLVK
jgi:predicted phage-related endonuclease